MCLVELLVQVALAGFFDELNVVVALRDVEAPIRCIGEHHLLLEPKLLCLPVDPFVGRADYGVLADGQVGLNGELLIETGLFNADYVGGFAEPFQVSWAQDDAELRRVIEHDGQGCSFGQVPYPLDDLLFGLGNDVRWSDNEDVESHIFGVTCEVQHGRSGRMGDVGTDEPFVPRLVGDNLHHL